jgi:hypothetical protein
MSYDLARDYAGIYATQDELAASEQQAARDAVISLGTFLNDPDDAPPPTPEQAEAIIQRIETLQGQLLLVDNFMQSLSRQYTKFLSAHPD